MINIQGFFRREGKFWLVELPALDQISSGESKDQALQIAKEFVEILLEEYNLLPCKIQIKALRNKVFLEASNPSAIFALSLKRLRGSRPQKEISDILQFKSINSYQQYENSEREPSISQAIKLLEALNPNIKLCLG